MEIGNVPRSSHRRVDRPGSDEGLSWKTHRAARRPSAFSSQHRLDQQRGHEPAARGVRRPPGADTGAGSLCQPIYSLHERLHHGAGVRAESRGDHHRDVSDVDRRAAHADDRRPRPRIAGTIPRGPSVLRQGVSRVLAGRRLLHDQPRQDGLSVRRAVHHLGRRGAGCALAQPGRQDPAVLLGVQSGGHAREPDFSVEPSPEGQAARHQPGCDPGAVVPIRTRRPCAKSSRGCTTTSPTWTRRSARS